MPAFAAREGESVISLAVRVIRDTPRPLVGVAPPLAAVVSRAMSKQPGERYPSAAALRNALQSVELSWPPTNLVEPEAADLVTEVMAPQVPNDEGHGAGARTPLQDRTVTAVAASHDQRGRTTRWLAAVIGALVIFGGVAALWTSQRHHPSAARLTMPPVVTPSVSRPVPTARSTRGGSPSPTKTIAPGIASPASPGAGSAPR